VRDPNDRRLRHVPAEIPPRDRRDRGPARGLRPGPRAPAVLAELKRSRRAELQPVRDRAKSPPEWLIVRSPRQLDDTLQRKLGPGEVEALSLAQELRTDRVLLDDRDAREAAQARHLQIAGTLAVLEEAACRDLIDMDQAIKKLRGTNYRATESFISPAWNGSGSEGVPKNRPERPSGRKPHRSRRHRPEGARRGGRSQEAANG
jgi:predicted nucleic acid-binding protein